MIHQFAIREIITKEVSDRKMIIKQDIAIEIDYKNDLIEKGYYQDQDCKEVCSESIRKNPIS